MIIAAKIEDRKRFHANNNELGNESELFADLDWELKRLNKYGHRFSVLFIEVIGDEIERFSKILRKTLRATDLLYKLEDGNFVAILPCTHETGGECAALRLKRETKNISNNKLNINVGVINIDTHTNKSPKEIYELVKKEVLKDRA